ncbi:DNA-binding transcriptional LysR family regulator [Paraburkholderia sp. BL23I1N1]|uniref:LysR family transcriptional regulator n=1 Tax=Paraburkholderia sp. BL23I1N1 TaxID=1938802 RepID=UPI000E72D7FC|nr:LysR family transcriptional regulator [Paraburkholderia sp. BL23I1N1]RKE36439.1 DNA-binding transcriptional LysR family regulator [Paraburkholderia sp. BL23I1N1]
MELRHLRYFLAIAEELHFTRAAERVGIGQPPLSQQIKQLEEELGAPLFLRTARGVALTAAGEAFRPHAEAAIREAERAELAVRRVACGEQGNIHIGFTSSASFNPLVPAIISSFREVNPDVEINLVEETSSSLLTHLANTKLDIAFLRAALVERSALTTVALPDEPLWIALPARHPLAERTELRLVELASTPFILYPRRNGNLLYDTIISACRSVGFSPNVVQEAPQMASMVNFVAAGVGVALVPRSMCQLHAEGVSYARISPPAPTAMLWLAHHRTDKISSVIHAFMRCAETILQARSTGLPR